MKGDNIFERLVFIAVETVCVVEALPHRPTTKHIGQQLVRSATSGEANYQEARGAESRKDFVHKLGISLKETRETHYWLRLLDGLGLGATSRLQRLLAETLELSRILASSIRTAKRSTDVTRPPRTQTSEPITETRS